MSILDFDNYMIRENNEDLPRDDEDYNNNVQTPENQPNIIAGAHGRFSKGPSHHRGGGTHMFGSNLEDEDIEEVEEEIETKISNYKTFIKKIEK